MGVFAYYDADTDGTVYHVIPSPESESAPSAFYSETDSAISGITIQSNELPGYFVLHHGRQQPASDNIVKWFPSDNIRRHILRYIVVKGMLGGDYVGPVKEMLSVIDGRERRALELGTRTGTWIQTMATEFPHVRFRSLDVVPMMPHVPRHNVTFEVYDFTEGLMLEDESQDVVFLNFVVELVKDFRAMLREVYRVLRPGGLIQFNDFSLRLCDFENVDLPAQYSATGKRHLFDLVREQISSMGIDTDTCSKLPGWLTPDSDLWARGQGGFKEIESVIRAAPVHPHDGFPCMHQIDPRISSYARHLAVTTVQDMFGVLKDSGMEDKEVEEWIESTIEDLNLHEMCAMIKVYCIYATKI